eukprot:15205025-Alexandrium_andersonii.AAC.1
MAFSVKELEKWLMEPRVMDWRDLLRAARYCFFTQDDVVWNEVDRDMPDNVQYGEIDADRNGDDDEAKGTSG